MQTTQIHRSKKHSNTSSSTQLRLPEVSNVKVYARLKPRDPQDSPRRDSTLEVHPSYVRVDSAVYSFDEVFSEAALQEHIFKSVAEPTVKDVF